MVDWLHSTTNVRRAATSVTLTIDGKIYDQKYWIFNFSELLELIA